MMVAKVLWKDMTSMKVYENVKSGLPNSLLTQASSKGMGLVPEMWELHPDCS